MKGKYEEEIIKRRNKKKIKDRRRRTVNIATAGVGQS
jgi:hypothetical protein